MTSPGNEPPNLPGPLENEPPNLPGPLEPGPGDPGKPPGAANPDGTASGTTSTYTENNTAGSQGLMTPVPCDCGSSVTTSGTSSAAATPGASNGPVAPDRCSAACNNALNEANAGGRTPEMCREDSKFRTNYTLCKECINAVLGEDDAGFLQFLDKALGPILEYCGLQTVTRTQTFVLPGGSVTTMVYVEEVTGAATSVSSQTGTVAGAGATESNSNPDRAGSKAWIAGVIVGPLVIITMALAGLCWLRRRRRRAAAQPVETATPSPTMQRDGLPWGGASPQKNAQEADGRHVYELDAAARRAEFAANETPARELPERSYLRGE